VAWKLSGVAADVRFMTPAMAPPAGAHILAAMTRLPLALAIALLVLAGPAAAAVKNGTYKGDTSQNRAVHAKVKGGKIKSLSFSVFTACGIGGSGGFNTDAVAISGVKIKANGSYKYSEKGDSANGKATYTLKGKVTNKKITGKIEHFFRGGCQTFDLTFTAKRR
jgi:hypothetical protein